MEEINDEEDEEEYIDLDELEEIEEEKQPQEKSKGKPIQERKRKNNGQQQFSLFDMMGDSSEKEENLTEKLIKHELKRGSGFERGKMRICHEYAKNPTISEFAVFLKDEYGLGGYGGGNYGASYDANTLASRISTLYPVCMHSSFRHHLYCHSNLYILPYFLSTFLKRRC